MEFINDEKYFYFMENHIHKYILEQPENYSIIM